MFDAIVVGRTARRRRRSRSSRPCDLAAAIGARLEIVSAYEPAPASRLRAEAQQAPPDVQWTIGPREDVEARCSAPPRAARRGRRAGARTHARQGDPADAILDVAEETGADLIVVGNKGMTGAKRFLLGSRAEQDQPPRALLGADHPHELSGRASGRPRRRRRRASSPRRRRSGPSRSAGRNPWGRGRARSAPGAARSGSASASAPAAPVGDDQRRGRRDVRDGHRRALVAVGQAELGARRRRAA